MQNFEYVLPPSHQGRPGPSTEWNRCAFPCGKACCGCAASLPPPLCTAVRRLAGADTPTAAVASVVVQDASPAYWSRPSPRSGRPSAALQRRSACGDDTAPILSRSATHAQRPIGATRRSMGAHRERSTGGARPLNHWPLLPEPAQATGWSARCRFTAGDSARWLHGMMVVDRCYTPV